MFSCRSGRPKTGIKSPPSPPIAPPSQQCRKQCNSRWRKIRHPYSTQQTKNLVLSWHSGLQNPATTGPGQPSQPPQSSLINEPRVRHGPWRQHGRSPVRVGSRRFRPLDAAGCHVRFPRKCFWNDISRHGWNGRHGRYGWYGQHGKYGRHGSGRPPAGLWHDGRPSSFASTAASLFTQRQRHEPREWRTSDRHTSTHASNREAGKLSTGFGSKQLERSRRLPVQRRPSQWLQQRRPNVAGQHGR